ncbi:hypothetical protein [Neptuniibacter sp. QD37_11]|uniref:hypothetical protein n=1 Tax=Neptuniibacter sp. QD37_11 TaxID=3398209 RepID=UPI0039F45894
MSGNGRKQGSGTFQFDEKTLDKLDELGSVLGCVDRAQTIRKAIALLDVAAEAKQNNQTLHVRDQRGVWAKELVL